jgi:hypothetical protein
MRAGRPRHRPTDEQRRQATLLSGYGIPQEQIATMLQLDPKTLRKFYRRELDVGAIQANAAVAQSLFQMATRDKIPAAAIWWTKARMGWKSDQDLTINGTQTIQMQHLLAAQAVSDALHNAPDTLPAEIEGTVDSEAEADEPQDLMSPALE